MAKRRSEYGQFCPVAMTAEIMGAKWIPLIVRELLMGSHRFSDLQRGVPLMSPALLSARLRELERAGVVERRPGANGKAMEYHLTEAGEELRPIVEMYGQWSQRWLRREVRDDELDPQLLMWDIRRMIRGNAAPAERRRTVRFELSGIRAGQRLWWIVFDDEEVDLCLKDPGYDIDLYVYAPLRVLTEIWMGRRSIKDELRARRLRLEGSRDEARKFQTWFSLSYFAPFAG